MSLFSLFLNEGNAPKNVEEKKEAVSTSLYSHILSDVPKISVRNLSFFYGKNQALHSNNLDIAPNKVTAVIGPSGCGKSTH